MASQGRGRRRAQDVHVPGVSRVRMAAVAPSGPAWQRPVVIGPVLLVLVLVIAGGAWVWWLSGGTPPARARVYRNVDACMLTDTRGLADPQAAAVWSGMQDASKKTSARVSYLPVVGSESQRGVRQFVRTLVQRKCTSVIGVGQAQVDAVLAEAVTTPEVRFVVIGSASGAGSNVVVVKQDSSRSEVAAAVERSLA